jgi:hypothetical protein
MKPTRDLASFMKKLGLYNSNVLAIVIFEKFGGILRTFQENISYSVVCGIKALPQSA